MNHARLARLSLARGRARDEALPKEEPDHPAKVHIDCSQISYMSHLLQDIQRSEKHTRVISSLAFISTEVIGRLNCFKLDYGCQ